MLPAAGCPRQKAVPRFDAFNESLIVQGRAEPDAITGGHDVALIGNQRAKQAPDGTAILSAVLCLDDTRNPMNPQHPAGQAGAAVRGWHVRRFLARVAE